MKFWRHGIVINPSSDLFKSPINFSPGLVTDDFQLDDMCCTYFMVAAFAKIEESVFW
jgi:hypothetical protein